MWSISLILISSQALTTLGTLLEQQFSYVENVNQQATREEGWQWGGAGDPQRRSQRRRDEARTWAPTIWALSVSSWDDVDLQEHLWGPVIICRESPQVQNRTEEKAKIRWKRGEDQPSQTNTAFIHKLSGLLTLPRWPLPLRLPVDFAARPGLEKRSAHGSSQSPVLIMLSMVPDCMALPLW